MTDKVSTNRLTIKCIDSTSWDSDPAKAWFLQPFVNYPDASKYSETRFQETFANMYVLTHAAFAHVETDVEGMIDNIKYFKRNLVPSATVPALPFLQRGVLMAGDDLVRSGVPGIFDKLYAENASNEDEEDLFLPFTGKKVDERKMSNLCTLAINGAMLHSDGMEVAPELKKQIAKEGFGGNGNFWDIRLPSRFISSMFDKEWNRFKPAPRDGGLAYVESYFLTDPETKAQLVRFNPVVFSMAFRVPFITDPFLVRKQVEEPSKTVLLNTTILYEILHGAVTNQMGNYAVDMHYNLLSKMLDENVGVLRFRNELLQHPGSRVDHQRQDFGVALLDFKNRILGYQQLFNLVLFYLMYATDANEALKQYARPDPRYDPIFAFLALLTASLDSSTALSVNALDDGVKKLRASYNEQHSDDIVTDDRAFNVHLSELLEDVQAHGALRIYTTYRHKDQLFMLSDTDILHVMQYVSLKGLSSTSRPQLELSYRHAKANFLRQFGSLAREIQDEIKIKSSPIYRRVLHKMRMFEAGYPMPLYYVPVTTSFDIYTDDPTSPSTLRKLSSTDPNHAEMVALLKQLSTYETDAESSANVDLQLLLERRSNLVASMLAYEQAYKNATDDATMLASLLQRLRNKAAAPASAYSYVAAGAATKRSKDYSDLERFLKSTIALTP